ncbi:hypothetical protein PTTG_27885 [Puccinia triticina 1-1 BBBD Race 1]|uniref:Uncharacterized protein n=1 Tax=Puccinia triticina (isolate 1-1 / race 1 (BBBD)) TaxID=630390 RepID=A0A180GG95_PUCT1|nr:hypothetical protein PTTG_27885 [Puccinia triticina 1-1 BBBD Race 1]
MHSWFLQDHMCPEVLAPFRGTLYRLLAIGLKINILCCVHWATAAFPAEVDELRLTTPSDPINLSNDNSDVFEGLDFDFLGSSKPKWGVENFDFSRDPHLDPSGFRPSEEADDLCATHDQGPVSYYRDAVGSKNGLIQAAAKTVAYSKSSETDWETGPSGERRFEWKGAGKEIQLLNHLQAVHPPMENEAHLKSSGITPLTDPIDLENDCLGVFNSLDSTFEKLKSLLEVFDSSHDPHSNAAGFGPSEQKDGRRANHEQVAESSYREEGVGLNRKLIEAPAETIAHSKSSEINNWEVEPFARNNRSGSKRATEEIQPLTLQALRPPSQNEEYFESARTVRQAGLHDIQRVGSSEILQVAQPQQPFVPQTNTPMQIEQPSKSSQTISEAQPYLGTQVGPNKRLRFGKKPQTPIDQLTQAPTKSVPCPINSISKSDQANLPNRPYQNGKRPVTDAMARETHYFGRYEPNMDILQRRVKDALEHQSPSEKKEFDLFIEKFNQKHKEIDDLYSDSIQRPSSETLMKLHGGLEMSVRKLGLPENHGERYVHNLDIRIPLKSKTLSRRYNPIFLKIKGILEALNSYHNLVLLNGLDQKIFKRKDRKILKRKHRHISKRKEANHAGLLQWFYEQLFIDTKEHPPLLGTTKIELEEISVHDTLAHPLPELREIGGEKQFNEVQKYLYQVLVEPVRPNAFSAGIVALDLLGHWYRAEFSKISADAFPAERFTKKLARALAMYKNP